MKRLLIIVLAIFSVLETFSEHPPFQLVAMLSDESPLCDEAYAEIINSTKANECIDLLILNGCNTNYYKGDAWINPYCSAFLETQPLVGTISLYLVDTIIKKKELYRAINLGQYKREEWSIGKIVNEHAELYSDSQEERYLYAGLPHPYLLPVIYNGENQGMSLKETSPMILRLAQALYQRWWISIGCKKPEAFARHPFEESSFYWN